MNWSTSAPEGYRIDVGTPGHTVVGGAVPAAASGAYPASVELDIRVVVNQGELIATVQSTDISMSVSGYLFSV